MDYYYETESDYEFVKKTLSVVFNSGKIIIFCQIFFSFKNESLEEGPLNIHIVIPIKEFSAQIFQARNLFFEEKKKKDI